MGQVSRVSHVCERIDYCICDTMAMEPNEDCPLHGHGPFPPRCGHCGRFLPWQATGRRP